MSETTTYTEWRVQRQGPDGKIEPLGTGAWLSEPVPEPGRFAWAYGRRGMDYFVEVWIETRQVTTEAPCRITVPVVEPA